jgi:hypothetical protein
MSTEAGTPLTYYLMYPIHKELPRYCQNHCTTMEQVEGQEGEENAKVLESRL